MGSFFPKTKVHIFRKHIVLNIYASKKYMWRNPGANPLMFHICFAPVLNTAHTCVKNMLCIYAAHTLHIRSTNVNVYFSHAFGAHVFHSLISKNEEWKWTTSVLMLINSSDIQWYLMILLRCQKVSLRYFLEADIFRRRSAKLYNFVKSVSVYSGIRYVCINRSKTVQISKHANEIKQNCYNMTCLGFVCVSDAL